ncbi:MULTISPECIES: recombinase family protein [unclassified Salinibacterium]|uniref:recombinase family protein n=2 Tax=unclassified Salinibacterium TaxID=2632331 RepID=UPI00143D318C|nr:MULTISPECIES: recombinase family protein [unclassified Salinibacterium]
MGTRRAALYLRQSLDRAEGIGSQRDRCTALANARGWQIVETFEDNETKASKARGSNTAWSRMLSRIGKDFEVIVAVDVDRLLRSIKDLSTLADLGAQIVTVDGEIDLTTADGEFRGTMLAGIARFETRRASERQQRHKAAKAARGEWHGGTPPYGYERDPETKSLVPNEKEVALIKEASTRLLDRGQSLHSIVVEWNDRGERTRKGHHWRQTGLRPILLNRSMLGETVAGVRGWDPIIDQQTFDRLSTLLTDPTRKIVHSPGANGGKRSLGGGLARCGLCGKPLITHSKATGKGKGSSTATLACLARVHGPDPENHPRVERVRTRDGRRVSVWEDTNRVSIAHDPTEEIVFEKVIALLNDTERWKARMQEKSPKDENTLKALEDRQRELNAELDGVGRSVMIGAWDERKGRTEVERIKTEMEDVNRRIGDLIGKPQLNAIVQGGKLENWREWPPLDRRSFLKLVVDRIEVFPYPDGAPRNAGWKLNETPEQAAERKALHHARIKATVESRIKVWSTWGALI